MHRSSYRPSASRRGYDRAWQALRDWQLIEYPLCVFMDHPTASRDCLRSATIADHIQPLQAGGERLDPANVRSVCRNCHAKLTGNFVATGQNAMPTV
jgi:5-methylcytosine-specific restriction endonuclease McrA